MRSQLARIAYVMLVLAVSSTSYLLIRDHQEEETFQQARLALLEGEYERAAEGFSSLETGWFWVEQSTNRSPAEPRFAGGPLGPVATLGTSFEGRIFPD